MGNTVYLRQLKIKDYKSFCGENIFNFAVKGKNNKYRLPQCIVFLGDNGTGKTNLLKVIANLVPEKVSVKDLPNNPAIPDLYVTLEIHKEGEMQKEKKVMYRPHVIDRYKGDYSNEMSFVVYHGNVRKMSKQEFSTLNSTEGETIIDGKKFLLSTDAHLAYSGSTNSVEWDVPELEELNLFAYGVNRFSDTKRNLKSENVVETLFFNGRPLINFEEWLLQLEIAKKDKSQKNRANSRINKIKDILKRSRLFPEISDYVVSFDDDLNSSVRFRTPNGDFHINELGYGYQCMLSWVFDFIKKMFDKYPDSEDPLSEPAVLLIDELDLHLHPQWQRHVLKDLCQLFPKTQIIVTTHSPLIIQSADSMNLYILRNEGGVTNVTSYDYQTFQGWSIEEILSELMELNTNLRSDEYQKLRDEFEHAMNTEDVNNGIKIYEKLKKMLHPSSEERTILDLDIAQLKGTIND